MPVATVLPAAVIDLGGPTAGVPAPPLREPHDRWRDAVAAVSQAVAFNLAAPIYSFLTAHETWRASCRTLGELVPGPRVLDLGIGPGTSALEMARCDGAKVHFGLDRSRKMLLRAACAARLQGTSLPLIHADGTALPIGDGALDGVTLHSLLYLVADPTAALAEIRRALRRGGRVALLEPRAGHPSLRAAFAGGARCAASLLLWRGMSQLHARFEDAGLVAMLERAGLGSARAWPVLAGYGVMATAERTE